MTQLSLFRDDPWSKFDTWVHTDEGREIAGMFIRLAVRMLNRGFGRYSAKALIERIRWHYDLKHGPQDDGFKVNNNYGSYLARFAMEREPRLEGFFETRSPAENKARRAVVVEIRKAGGNGA
jgi:hypothetical protein